MGLDGKHVVSAKSLLGFKKKWASMESMSSPLTRCELGFKKNGPRLLENRVNRGGSATFAHSLSFLHVGVAFLAPYIYDLPLMKRIREKIQQTIGKNPIMSLHHKEADMNPKGRTLED